ncbi:MAG: 16S rRNA (guanine(527)-N(7))-methyltransferase RsmG [Clostridiales bacterium]|nr:16S rRNA (guanine(527)-N(7))-methyltransferase RsmG [Clostridiales bacterium]
MDINEFSKYLVDGLKEINIKLNDEQIEKFYKYMNLLIDWNTKINLTAITEPKEIIVKHFIDSLTINKYINNNQTIIDVGTGAGFPGIPISIVREDCKIVLMDSLNKRINFLNDVKDKLHLENVETIHSRAEELGQNSNYREKFDIAVSRAVAPLNILSEYLLPFVKIDSCALCMKGANIDEELKSSENAIRILSGKLVHIDEFMLPNSDFNRNIIVIKKVNSLSKKYPRKSGTPSKEPLK